MRSSYLIMYKFSNKEYTRMLVEEGAVRIGTLLDYRKSEHARGVSDPKEGAKIVEHVFSGVTIERNSSGIEVHDKALRQFPNLNVRGKLTINSGGSVKVQKKVESSDCFIYCTSTDRTKEVMDQFDNTDSCAEITNPAEFFDEITVLLNRHCPVYFVGYMEVEYRDHIEKWNGKDWGEEPYKFKETEFSSQNEIRAVWIPKQDIAIEPIILKSERLAHLSKIVEVIG